MFDEFKEKIISIITSRLTILTLVILFLGGVLAYRCFDLQIVHGEEIFSTATGNCWHIMSWHIP